MPNFSPQLIEDYQKYFFKRFNKEISDEQANHYLHSLAGLFLLYAFPSIEANNFNSRSTARNLPDCEPCGRVTVISINTTPTPKI